MCHCRVFTARPRTRLSRNFELRILNFELLKSQSGFCGLKRPLGAIRAIVYGTIVVGTLDILDAIIFFGSLGIKPIRIFHSIASGLLGREAAFSLGLKSALLGAFL